ncbi:MAG: hypothetical protein P9L94_00490 [Candidatus Hinthialibacter antarcticus]|nr:hypothetical protein [Candidatus Hinthialibacter antarcticus]
MPKLIESPTRVEAAGNKPKRIDEYIGRVNSQTDGAECIAVCLPAFSMDTVHRDES